MLKPVLKKRLIYLLILMIILVSLFSLTGNRLWIEKYYATGIYQPFAGMLRFLFGWIPFSIGDIAYGALFVWLGYKVSRNFFLLFRKKLTWHIFLRKILKTFIIIFFVYGILMIFWGLNYSRLGISYQLSLDHPRYDTQVLNNLMDIMVEKVNESKSRTDSNYQPSNAEVFAKSVIAYKNAAKSFPFLDYFNPSVKSSLYGSLGNYLGFTGYYNPFSGEAQVNATVPRFLLPSITVHEMAHQIGYAKEKEANFVGFLVGSHANDPYFQYSAYLDLLMYTNAQVRFYDTTSAFLALKRLSPAVKKDLKEWQAFSLAHQSIFEPVARWLYGKFLKINNQPMGMQSYDEVTSLVIAYYQKLGWL